MAANIYGRVDHFAKGMNILRKQADPSDVAGILRELRVASASIDQICQQPFSATQAVRTFSGPGLANYRHRGGYVTSTGSRRLLLPPPHSLISASAVAVDFDGDDVFETVLSASDYWTLPANDPPITELEVRHRSGTIVAWPPYRNSVQITGLWGYSNDSESTGVTLSGSHDASTTTLILSAASDVQAGEILPLESEQVYVVAQLEPTKFTIERGVNGTTAAVHGSGTDVRRRVYPAPVTEAVYFYAARSMRQLNSGGSNPGASQFTPTPPTSNSERGILKALSPFMRVVVG